MPHPSEVDTVLMTLGEAERTESLVSPTVRADVAALSHQGKVRKNNEDHYLVVRYGRALRSLLTNLPEGAVPDHFEEVGYGMVVADGMGGAASGEVASRLAITTLVGLLLDTPDWIMKSGEAELERVKQRLADRYRRIAEVLSAEAKQRPRLAGMGTTMTLAGNVGNHLVVAHVGDSRAYLVRRGILHQLTKDHTLVQAMVEFGFVRPEDARSHRLRHVLTRSLGDTEERFEAEVNGLPLEDHDQVLLCTDGLTEMVDQATIATVLRDSPSATQACQSLMQRALDNGGKDNVTVALIRYRL
jgi:protein phosphatase